MVLGQALLTKPPKAAFRHQKELKGVPESQAPVNANAQDQQVKFEQSLEIVQTLLGASVCFPLRTSYLYTAPFAD